MQKNAHGVPDSKIWKIPEIWTRDDEVFVLGGGPSLKEFDVDRLRERHVVVVNNAYTLAPWADVLFFGDCRWWNTHRDKLLNFAGLKVTSCCHHWNKPGLKALRRDKKKTEGVSRDPKVVCWNISSGACAVGLTAQLGAGRIILLGFDMRKLPVCQNQACGRVQTTPGPCRSCGSSVSMQCNFHRDHPGDSNPKKNPYERFLKPFKAIAKDLKGMGIECLNATPGSALHEFPLVEIDEILARR